MSKIYVLYNPIAGNGACEKNISVLDEIFAGRELEYVDFIGLNGDLKGFFDGLLPDDKVVLCGGDGTINCFINQIDTDTIVNEVMYYPLGSGNDFYNDVAANPKEKKAIVINEYIKNLPFVEVNDIKKRFINAIGFGIDGYCCEEGDRQRKLRPGKPVNYTTVALKGLVYDYHRVNAKICVDDKKYEYKDVWMVPALNGRYYGGGMMCAPNQDRINNNNTVSVIIVSSKSRLKLLVAFMSIFKGTHIKYKSTVTELKGTNVQVEFDRPTSLQIDGETVTNVTQYIVYRR